MKQKLLILWNECWHYQIDAFFENGLTIDILVTTKETYPDDKIIKQANNVHFYNGPRWYDQTQEDYNNIKHLFQKIFKENKYDLLLPTWNDRDIEFFSRINEKTKMPGIVNFNNLKGKHNYYKIFNELNIPTPLNFTSSYDYPLICKPSYGTAGEGILICNSEKELQEFCKKNNTKDYIFQEYKQGKTVCVVGHIFQSKVNIDLIYDIEISVPPYCVETGFIFPSKFRHLQQDISNYLQKFINHINLDNSPFMLDLIIDDNDMFYFIDFSPRISVSIYDLMYHIDNKDYFYNIANKILNGTEFIVKENKCYIKKHFLISDRTIKDVNYNGIAEYSMSKKRVIDTIKDDFDLFDNTGYVISVDSDLDTCYKNIDKFLDTIRSELK